jgi:hypothetical protein
MADINGRWQNDPVLAKFGNGALEIFGVGTDGALWHRWQTAPNSGWVDGWHRFPDEFYHEPAIFDAVTSRPSVVLADGRFWVFLRSARGRILYIRHEPELRGWSDWKSIGGIVEGDPVVGNPMAVVRDNRIQVFARGRDGNVLVKPQFNIGRDDWGDWEGQGGVISGDPAPISVDAGATRQLLVYARGLDQQIWVRGLVVMPPQSIEWTALSCPNEPGALLSGNPVPAPTFVSWRGVDGRYRTKGQRTGSRIPDDRCYARDFAMAGDPVNCFHSDGEGNEIFWRAPNGGLMRWFHQPRGPWIGPTQIADGLLGQPVVNTSQNDRVEIIFRRGSSGELFHMFQTSPYSAFSS